jgi:hypothetical protein
MLADMTWSQFREWQDYAVIEPFGDQQADLRAGTVAATVANVHTDPKRRARPFKPSDFMPSLRSPEERRAAVAARQPLTDRGARNKIKAMARTVAGAREGR